MAGGEYLLGHNSLDLHFLSHLDLSKGEFILTRDNINESLFQSHVHIKENPRQQSEHFYKDAIICAFLFNFYFYNHKKLTLLVMFVYDYFSRIWQRIRLMIFVYNYL